ncbi:putative serine/threonine protein phosphatase 2B catalytic subunit A2 [Leishmania major strain Friedlin]|uniref:Putative serine/threonine protein phosphatase 2B catalytic subunit A2 n=1 Tax=Leishmania major TaxID=5664 RepID=Q4Q1M5_LEIMA|nr:putative serine/threonine protein phosphatase 2B catalytic subunit A2 [Leishmania major strain Friedlin]CAG9583723.1 serine/threonine_protein_phosphatase_2B_catalytic_subunit_A2_-_putative [Leishmania major strain Friedlin]CAJ09154.1 putative serine/threonine protein phosphatase 2B catalytic subunit A2 [Leishmania major strain Friedlin]|eukprot:XP_001686773.1 putative serine/threonine protein phosphatase 2B catalytic subunit A2 [Leishmania major strain Friedlin]
MSQANMKCSAVGGRNLNGTPVERSTLLSDGKLSLESIMLQFLCGEQLRLEYAMEIVQQAALVLRTEPNTLSINDTVVVVGDVQGQYYDLVKILAACGSLDTTNYLFLGNYIGNGGFNLECILFLLAAKVAHPQSILLIRGSNESKFMADVLQLGKECQLKYSSTLLTQILSVFNCLPLAAIIRKKFFCVHSGLSPDVSHVDDIALIHRFRHIPTRGAMCDMVWSEPDWDTNNQLYNNVEEPSGETYVPRLGLFETRPLFITNKQRGLSYVFNFACAKRFVSANNLLCIIRAHEVHELGFKLYRPHPNHLFPCIISLFSAPNYCSSFGNKGAVLVVSKETICFKQFDSSPHPCVLQGRNAFSWSLPFLESNLMSIFLTLLSGSDYDPTVADRSEKGSSNGEGCVTPLT